MTYDPPHRNRPPQQGRSPYATPAEPWQAYREDDAYPGEVPATANRQGSYWATAGVGTRSQPGYTDAARGSGADQGYRGYPPSSAPDPFAEDYPSVPPGRRDATAGYPALRGDYAEGQHGWNQRDTGQRHTGQHDTGQHDTEQRDTGQHEWSQNHWGADDRSQTYWGGNGYRGVGTGGYGKGGGTEYEPAGNAYGSDVNGYNQRGSGYHDAAASYDGEQADYGARASYRDGFDGAPVDQQYGSGGNSYAEPARGYAGPPDGYRTPDTSGTPDGYDGYEARSEFAAGPAGNGAPDNFAGASGYTRIPDDFGGTRDDFADDSYGYGGNPDDFPGAAEYQGRRGYSGPVPAGQVAAGQAYSGAVLAAPDADVYPDSWQADQARRREAGRRGTAVCAVTGVLAAAAAIGVSTLAAAFVGPQASPVHAVGSVFIDRPPAMLKNFAATHFGAHDRAVLLLGMVVLIAVLALGIGMLARRAATLGVAGLAGLSLLGAFITITRPESRVSDVLPSVFGCLAGVAALLWLVHASAPVPALRHARGNGSRRAR